MRDDYSEVFDGSFFKFTFLGFKGQSVLLEKFHNSTNDLPMFIQCLSENKDIIQINHHHTFGDEFFEDSVHHSLEGSGAIGQTKEHNEWFVETSVSSECGFPFMTLFHPDVIERASDIELSEVPSPL